VYVHYGDVPDTVGSTVAAETQAAAKLISMTDVINFRQCDVIVPRDVLSAVRGLGTMK